MDFEAFLKSKKIDPVTFQKEEATVWQELKEVFDQVHPDSFTAQKLFLINKIRRKYPLPEEVEKESATTDTAGKAKPKPKVAVKNTATGKPKPKIAPKVKIKPKIRKKE